MNIDQIYDLTDEELDALSARLKRREEEREEELMQEIRDHTKRLTHCRGCELYVTHRERRTKCDNCHKAKPLEYK